MTKTHNVFPTGSVIPLEEITPLQPSHADEVDKKQAAVRALQMRGLKKLPIVRSFSRSAHSVRELVGS